MVTVLFVVLTTLTTGQTSWSFSNIKGEFCEYLFVGHDLTLDENLLN